MKCSLAFINSTSSSFLHFFNTKKQIEAFAISAKQLYGKGDVITGNSSEFIDPVFSSGVTFATQSGLLAAKLVSKALNGQEVDWEGEYKFYKLTSCI